MIIENMRALYLTLIILFTSSCVGPFTPMGPLNTFSPQLNITQSLEKKKTKQENISLIPHELIFHKNIYLQIKIRGEDAKDFLHDNWKVFYRGYNISDFFEVSTKSTLEETILIAKDEIKFPNSFNDEEDRPEITIQWNKKGEEQTLNWPKAHCPIQITGPNGKDLALRSLGSFSNKAEIFTRLERASKENSINPNFYAGILAALSGLEADKVSSYKKLGIAQIPYFEAIGLTKTKTHWTKSRRIEILPNTVLIIFLKLGLIDTETDWRLNIEKSLIAGAEYLKNNVQFWQKSANLPSFKDDQNSFDRLIAASYILGPSVAKGLYDSYGKDWEKLKSQSKTKALIDLAFSYCSEFSSPKSDFEKEKSN